MQKRAPDQLSKLRTFPSRVTGRYLSPAGMAGSAGRDLQTAKRTRQMRYLKYAALFLTALTAGADVGQTGLVPVQTRVIFINATDPIAPAVVDKLTQAAEPIEIEVLPGEPIINAVYRHCAMLSPNYLRTLQEQYPDLRQPGAQVPRTVGIPFCATIPFKAITVTKDDTVWKVLQRSVLAEAKDPGDIAWTPRHDWRMRVIDANFAYLPNTGEFRKLRSTDRDESWLRDTEALRDIALRTILQNAVGKRILVAAGTIERVRANMYIADADAYLEAFRMLGARTREEVGGNGWLVAADPQRLCTAVEGTKDRARALSPIGAEVILRALKINALARKAATTRIEPRVATVYVADTGLIKAIENGAELNELLNPTTNYANERYKLFKHGTQVASLAMGGPEFLFINFFLRERIEVKMFNVVDEKGRGDQVIDVGLTQSAVQDFATSDHVSIINLSLEFTNKLSWLESLVNARQKLFVVAAGNRGQPMTGENGPYPATLGGEPESVVLTVTALAREGYMPSFSNYSKEFVDIGAIGCDVPVLSFDPERERAKLERVTGTSFAAPLVSFVAALIKRERYNLSAQQLKRRILFSANIDDNLSLYIRHGRVLNATKALMLYHDVVELKDGTLLYGKVGLPGSGVMTPICDEDTENSTIRKIALQKEQRPNEAVPADKFLVYLETKSGRVTARVCANVLPAGAQIAFKPEGVLHLPVPPPLHMGKSDSYDLEEIRDIVFAQKL
jgi:Subtilase family